MSHDYKSGDYQNSDSGQIGTALAFLLIGVGIGAAAGLLLAPKTGDEMRESLRQGYNQAVDNLSELKDKASTAAGDVASEVKNRATKLADSAKQTYENAKQDVKERANATHA